jgi:hypothetical protein
MDTDKPASVDCFNPNQSPLSHNQRALAAARQVDQFSPDAKLRQKAGTRARSGSKGKAAAIAGAQFGVSTRAVEQAIALKASGVSELLLAAQDDKITLSAAVALARQEVKTLAGLRGLLSQRARTGLGSDPARLAEYQLMLLNKASNRPNTSACKPKDLRAALLHSERTKILCEQLDQIMQRIDPAVQPFLIHARDLLRDSIEVEPCRCCGGAVPSCRLCHGQGLRPVR